MGKKQVDSSGHYALSLNRLHRFKVTFAFSHEKSELFIVQQDAAATAKRRRSRHHKCYHQMDAEAEAGGIHKQSN